MKLARRTDLDGIGLDRFFSAEETVEFCFCSWTGSSCWKFGAKHVGHLPGELNITDGTGFAGRATNVGCCPKQFRVSVTNIFAGFLPRAHCSGYAIAQQPIFDRRFRTR
jgi:hypothetical protein